MKYESQTKAKRLAGLTLGALVLAAATTHAANVTWTGGAADGVWSNPNNWDLGRVPVAGSNDIAYVENGDTITYQDGETNSHWQTYLSGSSILNFTGGNLNSTKSGNTRRSWVGRNGSPATVNQSGGTYSVGQQLRIGEGIQGDYNISGGILNVYRGGNSGVGGGLPAGASISIGPGSGAGTLNILGGTVQTRGGLEMGANATLKLNGGYPEQISLGGHGGTGSGAFYMTAGAVLDVSISTNGLTPIVLRNTNPNGNAYASLFADCVLDVGFIDGAEETNFWPVIDASTGTLDNAGMVFAAGVDTNDWGFITSNNTLYVGYRLGWSAGGDVLAPPSPGRTLYWTGAGGDTDANNPTNWVTDLAGTTTDWGPYNDDTWNIGNFNTTPGESVVVDYDGTSIFNPQGAFSVGNQAKGTLNWLSGSHSFATSTSSRQYIGHGSALGNGTVNVYNDTLAFNSLGIARDGATGTLNIYGGTMTVGRASNIGTISASIALAEDGAGGTGTVYIVGGRMFTRTGVSLGAGGPNSVGIFSVEGSAATDIGIGANSALDGAWYQGESSILKVRVDEGGITPIRILNKDAAYGGNDGNVYFMTGSTLDLGWAAGVTNYNTFDVMTWDGDLVESNLTLAAGVDTSIWSFEFVDANVDGTNDTLRATAYGETANGTPFGWLNSYGLSEADDDIDVDGDSLLTWQEYVASTDPTNGASVLAVTGGEPIGGNDFVITWQSVLGKSYSVITNTDLVTGTPGVEASGIIGLPNETSYTGTVGGASEVFYEIEVAE